MQQIFISDYFSVTITQFIFLISLSWRGVYLYIVFFIDLSSSYRDLVIKNVCENLTKFLCLLFQSTYTCLSVKTSKIPSCSYLSLKLSKGHLVNIIYITCKTNCTSTWPVSEYNVPSYVSIPVDSRLQSLQM